MTKEQEILERHLGCVLQTCYIKRNETAYMACLKAVKEALTIPVVIVSDFCSCDGVQDLHAMTGECRKCGKECDY